jgi:hypothetical protein
LQRGSTKSALRRGPLEGVEVGDADEPPHVSPEVARESMMGPTSKGLVRTEALPREVEEIEG